MTNRASFEFFSEFPLGVFLENFIDEMTASKLVQYVILRNDLLPKRSNSGAFSLGACIAQGCHAATAALFKSYSDISTTAFLESTSDMTVCVLGVENVTELIELSRKMEESKITCHLWIEKPEDIPTALATAPVSKEVASPILGHLKLLR